MAHILKLEEGEKIIKEVRRHLFVFYLETFGVFIAAIAPLLFVSYIDSFLDRFILDRGASLFGALYFLWLLICWIYFFIRWTDYYLDVWIITDRRIFDIEQKGLFHRNVSAFRLDRIQDITVEVEGVIATLLKFGDVRIHTAGEHKDIIIKTAANPIEVKNTVMEAQRKLSSHTTFDQGV